MSDLVPWTGRSDELVTTNLEPNDKVRDVYLKNINDASPPVIRSSPLVPRVMVEHLMRNKKNRAVLGAKFSTGRSDKITNMEGALHTFVCPAVRIYMHGDYVYDHDHTVKRFPDKGGKQQARVCVMSAMIHLDFENEKVMLEASRLADGPIQGELLPGDFAILPTVEKQDENKRKSYDERLKKHLIASLVDKKRLPSLTDIAAPISTSDAISLLAKATRGEISLPSEVYVILDLSQAIVSLELLFQTVVHQIQNEHTLFSKMCPQGYVYTYDLPVIFAAETGATLLNRLHFAALKLLSDAPSSTLFARMRIYAFSDYADEDAIPLAKAALAKQSHVAVMPKKELFKGKGPGGTYAPPSAGEGLLLVIHNNSDAFGQNIETEPMSSMDGAIGCSSSAAASLSRQHPQLTSYLI